VNREAWSRLARGLGGWTHGPILRSEIDTPEMRAWGKEFDTDTCALFGSVAKVDDAAFLFFFGDGIDEHDFGAQRERFLQIKQAAMRVDDDGLAVLAEFLAIAIFGRSAHGDAREDAGTAPSRAVLRFAHGYLICCLGPDTESTVGSWKVSKNAGRKKLAEIAQGS
jgi:hypothetical protein